MPEAFVVHVVLHLPEYGFRLDAPPSPVPDSLLGCQQFPGFPLVCVEPVIDLDGSPVTPGFIAEASQRTALAVLCAVSCTFAAAAACRLGVGGTGAGHVLSHGTDELGLVGVVVEVVLTERIGLVTGDAVRCGTGCT